MTLRLSFVAVITLALVVGLSRVGKLRAQPVGANPLAPVVSRITPNGVQRGRTLEVTLTGKNLAQPTGVLATFPGTANVPGDKKNGEDADKLRVRINVPAEAPLGYYALRLATKHGVSNLRIFCVDDLPQILEKAGNNNKSSAQLVQTPSVVDGAVDALKTDYYKVQVKSGQTLSFDVLARRLGSRLEPVVSIYEPKSGRKLAYASRSPGLQADARLTYTFRDGGEFLVAVKDLQNRGGGDYWFRLRIGNFPCAVVPIPMAAKRGAQVTVQFAGAHLQGASPVDLTVPSDPLRNVTWVSPHGGAGIHGWPVALALSDFDERIAQEPNDSPKTANQIPVPSGVTGRFDDDNDSDFFLFPAKKGQRMVLQAHTLEFYSPTLVYMVLRDGKGKVLARTKPEANPPADKRLEFTPSTDGKYTVEVQHLNFVGGANEAYHLTVKPKEPDFDVSLDLDRWDVAQGGGTIIPINVNRRAYSGPIEVTASASHPGITGKTTIGNNSKTGSLVLRAAEDVPPGPYALRLKAEAGVNGNKLARWVRAEDAVSEALYDLPVPPLHLSTELALAVTPQPPFTLTVNFGHPEAVRGLKLPVTLTLKRDAKSTEPVIVLPPVGIPGKLKFPKVKPIGKANKTTFTLPIDAKAPLGTYPVQFSAKVKLDKEQHLIRSLPANLSISLPFSLKVEPDKLQLKQGQKKKISITATRKGGYDGPIAVELRNLPANVKAKKATIAKGKNSAEVVIEAQPNAAPGKKKDVNVLGRATAAGNQQAASPNFTVSIEKK